MSDNYEEDLYFGDKYAFLYPCTGIFRSYKKEYIHQAPINKESVSEMLKYSDDLSYIKPEYKDTYVPVVPETFIHFKNWNLKDDEILTIGDQNNDIALLQAGGIKVAMENALPDLKQVADYITDTNDNDGITKFLDKYIFKI